MGNLITCSKNPEIPSLRLSNGLTSTFIEVLALAASALAKTEHQKELAIWIASHDQAVYGLGVIDFDISELPWNKTNFVEDRAFLLNVIKAAKAKLGWERLDYSPEEGPLFRCLDHLTEMLHSKIELAEEERCWPYGKPQSFHLCPKHLIFLHSEGCVICNNTLIR